MTLSIPAGCTGTIEIEGLVHEGDYCPIHEDENGRPLRATYHPAAEPVGDRTDDETYRNDDALAPARSDEDEERDYEDGRA